MIVYVHAHADTLSLQLCRPTVSVLMHVMLVSRMGQAMSSEFRARVHPLLLVISTLLEYWIAETSPSRRSQSTNHSSARSSAWSIFCNAHQHKQIWYCSCQKLSRCRQGSQIEGSSSSAPEGHKRSQHWRSTCIKKFEWSHGPPRWWVGGQPHP